MVFPGSQSPFVMMYKSSWPTCRAGMAFALFLLLWAVLCSHWELIYASQFLWRCMETGSCWPEKWGPAGLLFKMSVGLVDYSQIVSV